MQFKNQKAKKPESHQNHYKEKREVQEPMSQRSIPKYLKFKSLRARKPERQGAEHNINLIKIQKFKSQGASEPLFYDETCKELAVRKTESQRAIKNYSKEKEQFKIQKAREPFQNNSK